MKLPSNDLIDRPTHAPAPEASPQPQLSTSLAKTAPLPERTFGQKLADKMASKVGSWGFLIGQTTVLTAWVGCNLAPGLPHWDESPFILLNLVFSFASAYTAPVVLMSQNRQSDEDRAYAIQNHQVNLQTAHNLELLHQKMDAMYTQKLVELTELIQKQSTQQEAAQKPVSPLHSAQYIGFLPSQAHSQSCMLPMVDIDLFSPQAESHAPDSDTTSECN